MKPGGAAWRASLLLVTAMIAACVWAAGAGADADTAMSYRSVRYVDTPNGNSLHLREDASADSEILASIPCGAAVETFGYAARNWMSCVYRGQYGYAYAPYLSIDPPYPAPTSAPTRTPSLPMFEGFEAADDRVIVTPARSTGFVNLRWAPSLDMPVITYYYGGTVLEVLCQNARWCQVYDPQTRVCGFMMRAYLTVVEDGYGDGYGAGAVQPTDGADGVVVVDDEDAGLDDEGGVPDGEGAFG